MAFDLLIKNGRVVDGTGSPAFNADVGVRNGKIAAIGKLKGEAKKTIDAKGAVVAPGFIDSHCHFDAQVTWDPLCTFSCYHGATTVIIGNCSLGLAPVHKGEHKRATEFLSYVEAIPMETLETVNVSWETIGEYMDTVDKRLGVNVGNLIGHSPVRHYVMGAESQKRAATPDEIEQMRDIIRDGMKAGALGLSFSLSTGHYDPQGEMIPSLWAKEDELFALSDVLGELGTGVIQSSSGKEAEEKTQLMTRLSEASGRQVIYNQLGHIVKKPNEWKQQMKDIDKAVARGARAFPCASPIRLAEKFNFHNCQVFRGIKTWHAILFSSDEEKLKAFADPDIRKKLHDESILWVDDPKGNHIIDRNWPDSVWVVKCVLEKNQKYDGKSIREMAQMQGKGVIEAFCDLILEEKLDTTFERGIRGFDKEAMKQILNYPNAYIGLSDSGAHVEFRGGYGYSSVLLGYWVRQAKIMSVEQAVKRLSFDLAQGFGIYDRGLLRPGMAADIVIFDPDTIDTLPQEKVYDFPAGAWRMKEMATGVHYTVVNGEVLLEHGQHTGALPGRLLRNTLHQQQQ